MIRHASRRSVHLLIRDVMDIVRRGVICQSGSTYKARKRVFLCPGDDLSLVPPPYRSLVTVSHGYVVVVDTEEVLPEYYPTFFRTGLLYVSRSQTDPAERLRVSSSSPMVLSLLRQWLESIGHSREFRVISKWQGGRALSPDLLPFYTEISPGVTWCSGGSYSGTFTTILAAQELAFGSGERFSASRFYMRVAYMAVMTMALGGWAIVKRRTVV